MHDRIPDYGFSGIHHGAGKRGLCPYDDKRNMLTDLPHRCQNPNTLAYGHRDSAAEQHLVADQPEPGEKLIIRHPDERVKRRLGRVTRRLKLAGAIKMEEELQDGDAEGELHGYQLLMAERVTAARPGCTIRMGEGIERIISRDNLERPVSPPARMLAPPTPERAGPSGLNAHLPPFRRCMESSDEDEPERPVLPPRRPHLEFDDGDNEQVDTEPEPPKQRHIARQSVNPFIDSDAAMDENTSNDEGSNDENEDLDVFIVTDNIEF